MEFREVYGQSSPIKECVLVLKIGQVEEKMDNSTTQTDVIEWKREAGLIKTIANNTLADIERIKKTLSRFNTDINSLENKVGVL